MARTNNLSDFLIDIASAIKEKKGDNTDIPAANFDIEILNLPSQGKYQSKQLNITTNGNYDITPDTGYDAMDKLRLSINIPIKQLQTKTLEITTNGTYQILPDINYDGLSTVQIDVNVIGQKSKVIQ